MNVAQAAIDAQAGTLCRSFHFLAQPLMTAFTQFYT
jgi:hypothetical protein